MLKKKKLPRFVFYGLLGGTIGCTGWVWLGTYPQPLLLVWGDFQLETTFRFGIVALIFVFGCIFSIMQGVAAIVRRLRTKKFETLLERLFQGIVSYAVDDTEQVEKILRKLDGWRDRTPWVALGRFFWKRTRGENVDAELGALTSFPEADPLVTRLRIEQALETGDGKVAWGLFIEAFERGQKNPWFLTHFFKEAIRHQELEWATRLFQKLRKTKLPDTALQAFNAQLFFLQAELLVGDPLRREFLLRRAQALCPQDPQISLAFLTILANQGKKIELEKCLERAWQAFPDVRFVGILLNFFKEEPASLRFKKVQYLLGDWKTESGERCLLSALVFGAVAIEAKLETAVAEALSYLEEKRPLWAAFLRVFAARNQEALEREGRGAEIEKLVRDFVTGDPILRDLLTACT